MLLSWRERYIAVLGSNRVGLCRRLGQEVEWLGSSGFESGPQPPGFSTGDPEQLLLERADSPAGLQVLLSGSFARFFLVPWRDQVSSPAELDAFARMYFDDVYGTQGEDWQLRLSPESAGLPRVASAIEAGVTLGVARVASACSLSLVSVQPYLMAAFNRFRGVLEAKEFLFVLAEQGRCCLLLVHDGGWRSVRTVTGVEDGDALAQVIDRECRLHQANGANITRIYLHAPGHEHLPTGPGVQPLSLQLPRMALRDALYVMAQAVS